MSQQQTPWWKVLAVGFAGMAVLFAGMILWLPRRYYVSRSLVVEAAQDQVYAALADFHTWPRWAVWFESDKEPSANGIAFAGPAFGPGAEVSIAGPEGPRGSFVVVQVEAPRQLTLEAYGPDRAAERSGLHRFQLEPEGEGTRIVWSMIGESGDSWLGGLTSGPRERSAVKDFDSSLRALKSCVESGACGLHGGS